MLSGLPATLRSGRRAVEGLASEVGDGLDRRRPNAAASETAGPAATNDPSVGRPSSRRGMEEGVRGRREDRDFVGLVLRRILAEVLLFLRGTCRTSTEVERPCRGILPGVDPVELRPPEEEQMIYSVREIRPRRSVESRLVVVVVEAVPQSLELSASVCAASEVPSPDRQF